MDVLVIHDAASSRVRLAKALQSAAHRVTLSESVAEAAELLQHVQHQGEAPTAIVIAEQLLGPASAELRRHLAERFADLMWIPLRQDLEIGWLARWLGRLELETARRERTPLNVVLVEANHGLRRGIAAGLTKGGDTVVACSSVVEARGFLDSLDTSADKWVLVAPVICRGTETISLFMAARRRLPNLRWVVSTPARTRTGRTRHTLPDLHGDLHGGRYARSSG